MSAASLHAARRDRLRAALRGRGLDALLVSADANRYYLSGFELHDTQFNESSGRLVICADGRDRLATDSRFHDAARRLWKEDDILIYGGDVEKALAGLLRSCGTRIGFEAGTVSHAFLRRLAAAAPDLALEDAGGLVEKERAVKDSAEIAALERSFRLNHAMFDWIAGELIPGRTEREIAWLVEKFFRENGAQEPAFPTIVAVGTNAALPHAIPGDDVIPENGVVLVDAGCRVDGYCSDQTRTFWVGGSPSPEFSRALDLTRKAQKAALDGLRPGLTGKEAYALARRVFEEAGVEKFFTHGLGHGVGLETHERPSLSSRFDQPLLAGMTVTVEPGLYYPEWGGVRWEHTALITEDGARVL